MSASAEFEEERRQIDSLLGQGYRVAGIAEDLDGARVKFIRREPPGASVELLLLTADARKHVTSVIFDGSRLVKASEGLV